MLSSGSLAAGNSCRQLLQSAYSDKFSLKASDLQEFDKSQKLKLEISRVNNEKKSYYFAKAKIKGGALLGVGGDVNLNLAVMAKHSQLFIYDMDPRVIGFHEVIQAGFKAANSPTEFVQLIERWQTGQLSTVERATLTNELGPDKFLLLSNLVKNSDLSRHFKEVQNARNEENQAFSYLGSQVNFDFLKSLYENGKVELYVGSHFDSALLNRLVEDVKASGQNISSIYFSNSLEPRWIIDHNDPSTGMLLMMSSLGSIDRGSAVAEIQKIKEAQGKAKSLSTEEAEREMSQVNEQLSFLAMRAQMLALGQNNWNILAGGMAKLPLTPEAQVFTTALEPFEIASLNKKQFQVLGEENSSIEGVGTVQWSYASAPAKVFVSKMPNAPLNFADWIIAEIQKIVE